jgi:transcriptional regulator with GAF, ATPase, and Fis domain
VSVPDRSRGSLAQTFVALADTLVEDYDVVDLLDQLVRACVDLLGVTAAGLLLDDQRGGLAVVASSSEESRVLEAFQLQNDQGPCLECVRSGTAVTCTDLAAELHRWPLFVPAALEVGIASVVALPMRLRGQTIGALNLFSSDEEPAGPEESVLAQALADVATIGILQQRSAHRSAMLAEQLQHALNSRILIEQAKGVLAERHTVSMEMAFAMLRRTARDGNLKLTSVAQGVVDSGGDVPPA